MARQWTAFRSSQSIAGAALVGFGMFALYENLAAAAAWLSHVRSEALGVVPAVILELSQGLQATDSQRFLQALLRHMMLSSWPLLLIVVGTVLSRDKITRQFNEHPKKNCGVVDLAPCRSALEQKRYLL